MTPEEKVIMTKAQRISRRGYPQACEQSKVQNGDSEAHRTKH